MGFMLWVLIGVAMFILISLGGIMVANEVEYECNNFGKTEIYGTWYTCAPMKGGE